MHTDRVLALALEIFHSHPLDHSARKILHGRRNLSIDSLLALWKANLEHIETLKQELAAQKLASEGSIARHMRAKFAAAGPGGLDGPLILALPKGLGYVNLAALDAGLNHGLPLVGPPGGPVGSASSSSHRFVAAL